MNTSNPKSSRGDYPAHDPQFFYEYVRDRLATQHATITALDEKIVQLFTVATALLAIVAAVFAVVQSFSWWQAAVGTGSILAYLFVADQSWSAYREREWKVGPSIRQVWDRMYVADEELVRWSVAKALWSSHDDNTAEAARKATALPWIFWGVLIQCALVVLALVLVAVEA